MRPYQEKRTYVKDCNGVEIYEGDEVVIKHFISRAPVLFQKGTFGISTPIRFSPLCSYRTDHIKIIPKEGE